MDYAVGGLSDGVGRLSSVERYDPAMNAWEAVAPMATARDYHAVAMLDGKLYAVGGRSNGASLSSVERYDPALDAWEAVAPMASALAYQGRIRSHLPTPLAHGLWGRVEIVLAERVQKHIGNSCAFVYRAQVRWAVALPVRAPTSVPSAPGRVCVSLCPPRNRVPSGTRHAPHAPPAQDPHPHPLRRGECQAGRRAEMERAVLRCCARAVRASLRGRLAP